MLGRTIGGFFCEKNDRVKTLFKEKNDGSKAFLGEKNMTGRFT